MLINFASDLPCKVKDYKFTKLRSDESILLKNSEIADLDILSKGKFIDYYASVDFDGLVLFRKKSGIHSLFRMKVNSGKRSYFGIDGFIMPDHPELLLLSKDTEVYSFTTSVLSKKDPKWNFDLKYLPNYTEVSDLSENYKYYVAVMTPITKQGVECIIDDLPKDFNDKVIELWKSTDVDQKGLKITHLTNGSCSKTTAAIINLEDQRVVDGFIIKSGDPCDHISVDLHNHTLPGVDDGSKSEEETLKLIEQLSEMGIEEIVLTPHDNQDFNNLGYSQIKFDKLKDDYESLGVDVHLSSEHKATESFVNKFHINQGLRSHPHDFILLEFDKDETKDNMLKIASRLSAMHDRLIIAHVERYKNISLNDIKLLSSLGLIIQCNYKSISGDDLDVADFTERLVEEDLIDVLATDVHRLDHIEPTLDSLSKFKNIHIFNEMFRFS